MSLGLRLRALGRSLITRKFPRTRSTAEPSPAAVSRGAAAAGATAAFAGLVGSLYFKKDTTTTSSDQSAGRDVATTTTNAAETGKEEPPVVVSEATTKDDAGMDDAAVRAMFMGKDGKMRWCDYVDYLTFGKTFNNVRYEDHYDDEAKERRRAALRYERFKLSAKKVDKYHALSEGVYLGLGDREDIISDEEWELMTPYRPLIDQDWEEYVETLKAIQAHCKLTGESSGNAIVILKHLGKDYSHHDQKGCSIEEGRAKREARREEARRLYFEEKAKKKFWK